MRFLSKLFRRRQIEVMHSHHFWALRESRRTGDTDGWWGR